MRLAICAIGRLKKGPAAQLCDDYAARIARAGPQLGVQDFQIIEKDAPRGKGGADKGAEARLLLAAAPRGAALVSLDERGEIISSAAFAETMARIRDRGAPALAFLIGGADGLGGEARAAAELEIALGRLTWPHALARVMILEQIYRGMTIMAGHPYHRA